MFVDANVSIVEGGIEYLPDDSRFKDDEHKEGEERVVPVLVQTP